MILNIFLFSDNKYKINIYEQETKIFLTWIIQGSSWHVLKVSNYQKMDENSL